MFFMLLHNISKNQRLEDNKDIILGVAVGYTLIVSIIFAFIR